MRRARPYLAVGWFWFLGMLVPVIGLVQSGAQQMADRYTYLPLIGVFIMLVWGVSEAFEEWEIRRPKPEGRKQAEGSGLLSAAAPQAGASFGFRPSGFGLPQLAAAGLAGLVLLACAAVTSRQVGWWRDNQRLFQHALDVTQGNYMAHNNLAGDYLVRGEWDGAIEHYQTSLAMQPLQTHQLEIHIALAKALSKRGRYAEAAGQFAEVLQAQPDNVGALVQLGIARARQGMGPEAERAFAEALRLDPNNASAHDSFGNVLAQEGRHEEAVRQFEEALRAQPDNTGTLNNLAISCKKLGRVSEAIGHYREAIRLQPDSVEALNNLAWMLAAYPDAQFRNGAEAVQLATRACELTKYQNPVTLTTLAAAYAETGQFQTAISFAEQAQELAKGSQGALAGRLSAMIEAFRAGRSYHAD
jgi:Flp pilus assembly protein TadD